MTHTEPPFPEVEQEAVEQMKFAILDTMKEGKAYYLSNFLSLGQYPVIQDALYELSNDGKIQDRWLETHDRHQYMKI